MDEEAFGDARRKIAYFQTHDAYIHYDGVHQTGCPIGSSAVESFCSSQMQSRLKNQGQFWTSAGISHFISLNLPSATLTWISSPPVTGHGKMYQKWS